MHGCLTSGGINKKGDSSNGEFSAGRTILSVAGVLATIAAAKGGGGGNPYTQSGYAWDYQPGNGQWACALLISPSVHAHGGGLNSEGCHNNHKTGDYHCHREPAIKPQQKQVEPSNARCNLSGPTCYTGPRGGTYTITPSGRKNYKGC